MFEVADQIIAERKHGGPDAKTNGLLEEMFVEFELRTNSEE
jgi:hypothetical protein